MLFKLKDIQPNPFRNVEKYPLREDKLEDLKESIEATTYWDNIVARVRKDGRPEIAFGHHRLEAMKQMFKPSHEITLIIRDLSDAQMIQMMARENNESYKTNALVIMESVRATVQALAEGRISSTEMPIAADTRHDALRVAPLFSTPCERATAQVAGAYTALSVAKFLGMEKAERVPQKKLIAALGALELIEQGLLSEATLRKEGDIGTERLYVLVHELQQQRDAAQRETDRKLREAQADQERLKKQQDAYEIKRAADLKRAKEAADAHEARRIREAAETKKKELERQVQAATKQVEQVKQEHVVVKQAIKAVGQELASALKNNELNANRAAVQAAGDKAADRQGRKVARPQPKPAYHAGAERVAREIREADEKAFSAPEPAGVSKKIVEFATALVSAGKKQLSLKYAQDKGGSKNDHQAVNAAASWLLELIQENA